ncbi:hypothetical protein HG530_011991 [Fusarium avenaceum]|nr:hypothetical protein HG530_011991 [Fusarium avenaceum]
MPSAQTPASQETRCGQKLPCQESLSLLSGLRLGRCRLLLGLAQLLEFLLADNLGCTIGVHLDIASLVLALELLDRNTSLLGEALVVGLGELLGLSGSSGIIVALVFLGILHLLVNLLDELLGLLELLGGSGSVGLLVVGNAIGITVVSAGLLDGELASANNLTSGGDVGTLGQKRLALELAELVLELDAVAEAKNGALLLIHIILEIAQGVDTET